jgi:hypothetical protein
MKMGYATMSFGEKPIEAAIGLFLGSVLMGSSSVLGRAYPQI